MPLYLSMPCSRVNTRYSIQRVQRTPRTASSQDRLSATRSQSLSSQRTVLYSILYIPTITSEPMNRVSASIAHAFQSTDSRFTASRLTAFRSSTSRSTASKYSSNVDQSCPPTASLSSLDLGLSASQTWLDHGLRVHLWVHSILASKCISTLAQSRPPSESLSSLDLGQQVHRWYSSIPATKYIFEDWWWVYSDTGVMEMESVTVSIYSAEPGVDRHHLVSISSYDTIKIHSLSFPTVGPTRSVQDFVDLRNCVDPQCWIVH